MLLGQWLFAQDYKPLNELISISTEEENISEVLKELNKISKAGIIFSNQLFPKKSRTKIEFTDTPLGDVLFSLLAAEKVNFKIIGKDIVLFKEQADNNFTLSGFVREKRTGEGIVGAAVVRPYINKGTFSNAYGFYSLTLPAGFHRIKYFSFGSQESNGFIYLENDTTINKYLETTLTLSEVIVTAIDSSDLIIPKEPSRERLTSNEIQSAPALAGESDLIRSTFLLPGVQSGGDGLGGLFVRGGSLDQNLVLLDGVPVYNSSHLLGIYSIFNSQAIRSAELYKGAIPSRYGGRLSSVLDVRTKEGNDQEFDASFKVGLISAKASIEGPIVKEKSAFFLSYRRALTDLYLKPISRFFSRPDDFINYNFQDINLKVNSKFGTRDQVYLSFYTGGDFYGTNREEPVEEIPGLIEKLESRIRWGNAIGSFRWNHIFGNKVFSNTNITYSRYNFKSQNFIGAEQTIDSLSFSEFDVNQFASVIQDIGIKQDFEYFVNSNHELRFGANVIRHQFDPLVVAYNQENQLGISYTNALDDGILDQPGITVEAYEGNIYFEDDFRIGKKLFGNIGIRGSMFHAQGSTYSSVQPRVAINYKWRPKFIVRIAYDRMNQPLHLLQSSRIGLPSDLWVPSSRNIGPETSQQILLAQTYVINKDYSAGVEGYYKKLNNQLTLKEGTTLNRIDAENWQGQVAVGTGETYGLEFWLRKKMGRFTGNLNYTLASSERNFAALNDSIPFPFRYDRRHFFKTAIRFQLDDKWFLTSSWVYGTGNGISEPRSVYPLPSQRASFGLADFNIFDFDGINNVRLESYHRLDIAMNMEVKTESMLHHLQIAVFNAYGRKNPLYKGLRNKPGDPDQLQEVTYFLIGVLPSISYGIKF